MRSAPLHMMQPDSGASVFVSLLLLQLCGNVARAGAACDVRSTVLQCCQEEGFTLSYLHHQASVHASVLFVAVAIEQNMIFDSLSYSVSVQPRSSIFAVQMCCLVRSCQ
jgi:hypothetical protein